MYLEAERLINTTTDGITQDGIRIILVLDTLVFYHSAWAML